MGETFFVFPRSGESGAFYVRLTNGIICSRAPDILKNTLRMQMVRMRLIGRNSCWIFLPSMSMLWCLWPF